MRRRALRIAILVACLSSTAASDVSDWSIVAASIPQPLDDFTYYPSCEELDIWSWYMSGCYWL